MSILAVSFTPWLDAVISLAEIETELPLAEVYDGVMFSPETNDSNVV